MNSDTLHKGTDIKLMMRFLNCVVCYEYRGRHERIEFWAKNWSRRRLKTMAKGLLRDQHLGGRVFVDLPDKESYQECFYSPWGEASVIRLIYVGRRVEQELICIPVTFSEWPRKRLQQFRRSAK